ncbi:hemolysin III family protein [uncultured Paludibaculum sp.]|uniref:PAQR family membrane homeostasis protein TrhA n=1 Tax=uncultured Paludibaculum sp. TaxID=1765020 RepID=UPI002AAAD08D|nr:hemolysin III family protein [uncultured Paludibaculum sp.]
MPRVDEIRDVAVHAELTLGEEIANSVTHGAGALLSVAGLVVMVATAALDGSAVRVVACSIYGASLVLLYTFSTLYHALTNRRAKRLFRVLDHISIYLLIAGTYTPFTLVTLHGAWGWALFGVVWGLAVLGIGFKAFFTGRMEVLSTSVYILMGWVGAVAIRPLLQMMPWTGFLWLLAGGLCYTLGVAFYSWRRKYSHAVWHLFVLAGSACHFFAVWRWVLGR